MLFALPHLSRLAWRGLLTAAMFVGTLVVAGVVVVYLPSDYFTRTRQSSNLRNPVLHWAYLILKNLVGLMLIVLGIVLLVLPGQGVLTMVIGLLLMDFPGKRKLASKIIRRSRVLNPLNRLRARFGKPPLVLEKEFESHPHNSVS
jgi:hypothetical protein